jgi:hypothetical protein
VLGGILATTLRHFFPAFSQWLRELGDPRDPMRIVYEAPFLVMMGIMMFLEKLGARRQVKFEFGTEPMRMNINSLAGTDAAQMAHPDTLQHLMKRMRYTELVRLLATLLRSLIRTRALDRFRMLGYRLAAVDATGHLVFNGPHCPHCLTQVHGDVTTYYHMVLEAKLVTYNGMAFSMATEFIENAGRHPDKQDCEQKAFARLAPRLKATFPQMPMCLLLDSLYLGEPVMALIEDNGWKYVITFKEGSAPAVWREFEALSRMCPENRLARTYKGARQKFRWVNGIDFGGRKTNVLECVETAADGSTTRYAWATNIEVTKDNVSAIANEGGRLRWKIENEGFNEQKNGGYNLEHAYSEKPNAAKNYYILLQIAQLLETLVQKGSLLTRTLGRTLREVIGGVRKLASYLKESLRNHLIPDSALDPVVAQRIQIRFDSS